MSTVATIKIEGLNFAKAYKHWDGDPDATYPWLKSFNETFAEQGGYGPDRKLAQLLRDSKAREAEFRLDKSNFTGWRIVPFTANVGEEFEYTLHESGAVTIKSDKYI